ncbi:MAG: flagellar hook-length control protein FliK [Phycisphaerae bacterium]
MSEMSSLAQLVSSEPPAAPHRQSTQRRNYTDESNPRTREVDDDAIRRHDQSKADRTADRTDDDRDSGNDSKAADDEGSFRSHVRKAMERNQPKDGKADNAKPSKTALLQAALATAEQVSGEKSAQKTVSLSALTGQAMTAEDAPDGVHRAVLAALGQQAKARNAETPETPGGAKAGQLLVKDSGQAAPADATDKSTDGKQVADAANADTPKTDTPHAKGEEVVAQGKADTAAASAKNIQKETPTVAGEVAEKPQTDQGEGESKMTSELAQPSAAVSGGLQAGQGAAGQQTGDGQSRDDGQGRFVLNTAAANPVGRDTATAPGSDGQTFEATIETVSQSSPSASTVGTPTIATAATAAQSAPAGASVEGADEVSPADQVFAQMRGNLRGAGDSMVIRLDPPELGRVRISLEMDSDGLRAQIRTDNAQTLGDLQREAQTLITRLTEAGIQVRRVDIQPTEQNGERPMHDPADGQAQQGANPQEAQDHSGGAQGRDGQADTGDNGQRPAYATQTTNEPQDKPDASPTGGADGSINVMM